MSRLKFIMSVVQMLRNQIISHETGPHTKKNKTMTLVKYVTKYYQQFTVAVTRPTLCANLVKWRRFKKIFKKFNFMKFGN